MATYLHFAPAIALAVAIGPRTVGWRLTLAGAFCAVLPDADFALVTLGLDRYSGPYGHRGFMHSLGFALALGAFGALWAGPGRGRRLGAAAFLALCTLSHPLLDGLIDRGICNAWWWPLDGARHCLGWRPIPMRGVGLFGALRFQLELLWIGGPLLALANAGMLLRRLWRWARRARVPAGARRLPGAAEPGGTVRSPAPGARWGGAGAAAAPAPARDGPRAQRQLRAEAMRAFATALRLHRHGQRCEATGAVAQS